MKNKLKNRTVAYIKPKQYKKLKKGDIILWYPSWCSNKKKIGKVTKKYNDWVFIGSIVLHKDLIFKVVTRKYPEYFL